MTALVSHANYHSSYAAETRPLVAAGWLRGEQPAESTMHRRQGTVASTPAPAPVRSRSAAGGRESAPRATRTALRQSWNGAGQPWDRVPAKHIARNLSIARAYLETDETLQVIAANHGISQSQVLTIARHVVYATLALIRSR
jgi:hypothetical protein